MSARASPPAGGSEADETVHASDSGAAIAGTAAAARAGAGGAGAGSGAASAHFLQRTVRQFLDVVTREWQAARVALARLAWEEDLDTPLKDFFDTRPGHATDDLPPGHPVLLVYRRTSALYTLGVAARSMLARTVSKRGKGARGDDVAEFLRNASINGGRGGGTGHVPITAMHHAFRHVASAQLRVAVSANVDGHTQPAFRAAALEFNAALSEFYSGTQRAEPVFHALERLLAAHQEWRHPGEPPRLAAKLMNAASVVDIKLVASALDKGDERAAYPLSLVALKNERGVSGDPAVQNLAYYGRNVCCDGPSLHPFPMFLVSMAGPELRCHGAIVRSQVHVGELFRSNVACASHSEAAIGLASLYAAWFDGCELVRDDVEASWARLPVHAVPNVSVRPRLFPDVEWPKAGAGWLTTEPAPTSGRIQFIQHVARGVFRATFMDRIVIVKFCTRNDTDTQVLCAAKGAAAAVLCDTFVVPTQSDFAAKDCVAWRMVVMEDLEGEGFVQLGTAHKGFSTGELEALREGLESALRIVHDADRVFCDVRPPNIMVRRSASPAPSGGPAATRVEVRLIDFEFCGPVGAPWPGVKLNTAVKWPFDVPLTGPGQVLRATSQDLLMVDTLMGSLGGSRDGRHL